MLGTNGTIGSSTTTDAGAGGTGSSSREKHTASLKNTYTPCSSLLFILLLISYSSSNDVALGAEQFHTSHITMEQSSKDSNISKKIM
jgi:hypothetical protein